MEPPRECSTCPTGMWGSWKRVLKHHQEKPKRSEWGWHCTQWPQRTKVSVLQGPEEDLVKGAKEDRLAGQRDPKRGWGHPSPEPERWVLPVQRKPLSEVWWGGVCACVCVCWVCLGWGACKSANEGETQKMVIFCLPSRGTNPEDNRTTHMAISFSPKPLTLLALPGIFRNSISGMAETRHPIWSKRVLGEKFTRFRLLYVTSLEIDNY